MVARSAAERSELASLAAHERWSQPTDRTAATAPGRAALRSRFDAELDPSITDPDLRANMISHAISAWLIRERRTRRAQAADIVTAHNHTEPDHD
jgi:hypothetical protein